MKVKYLSLTGVVFVMLVGMAMSGCASDLSSHYKSPQMADSMSYVRQHKGEGLRRSLLGSEAELMDMVAKKFAEWEPGSTIVREPHAVFAKAKSVELSYAFYFYPSQKNGQTEVEVVVASPWNKAEDTQKYQKDALTTTLFSSYINARLLEEGYDPNVKEGRYLALTTAVSGGYRKTAEKLINKGANLDLAINELKEIASMNLPYLDKPANRSAYDKANLAIEMLNGLKIKAKQSEAEKVTDARFQEALRAHQKAAVKPPLPEAAQRFKVQAEEAVREKKFDDAADLFGQALNIAPLWPEGHFNRALVLGETGDYETAVSEMKRYLLLVPNAPNARAAQDKIYVWERKAGDGK